MNKNEVRNMAVSFVSKFGENIRTKIENICGKTGKGDVPEELFQKRTSRKNRVLISWKSVKDNNMTIEQLNTFYGGIVVEFKNNDIFDKENYTNSLFIELLNRLGEDENVSSIITIRSEDGNSSSSLQRECFEKLTNNFKVMYKGTQRTITKGNYTRYALKQIGVGGQENDKWSGFLFISIKGGQQDTIETHSINHLTLFNPAVEYASEDVCTDIDLVLCYFILMSIDKSILSEGDLNAYNNIMKIMEETLNSITYDIDDFSGTLLKYCKEHYSLRLYPGFLYDPIQLKKISINAFNEKIRNERSIDLTHNEAVDKDRFYWDEKRKVILSPARPTNLFWSYHLSNMMQQNYNLDEYFKYEKERYEERNRLLEK